MAAMVSYFISLLFLNLQNAGLQQHPPVRRALSFDFPSRTEENPDEELKASLQELNKCWEKLQTQVNLRSALRK